MASQHQKKTSIPRPTHDCDKTDLSKSKLRGPKPPAVAVYSTGHPVRSLPQFDDGLIPEDNDAVRRSLLDMETDKARMREQLEQTVREAEERLQTMQKLLEEREKLMAAHAAAEADKEKAEKKLEEKEQMLLENNIDPATGETIPWTEEQKAALQKQKKVTKGDVSKMRDTLHTLSENSDQYLIDVQKILSEIEEVEAISLRVGGLQPGSLSQEEMAEILKAMEEATKKEEKQKKRKEAGEERGEESEGEPEEGASPVQTSSDETFLTQNQIDQE